jgi:hypothetical protein
MEIVHRRESAAASVKSENQTFSGTGFPALLPMLFHSFSCAERLPELVAKHRVGLPYVVGGNI